jgi:hypothetical protein
MGLELAKGDAIVLFLELRLGQVKSRNTNMGNCKVFYLKISSVSSILDVEEKSQTSWVPISCVKQSNRVVCGMQQPYTLSTTSFQFYSLDERPVHEEQAFRMEGEA